MRQKGVCKMVSASAAPPPPGVISSPPSESAQGLYLIFSCQVRIKEPAMFLKCLARSACSIKVLFFPTFGGEVCPESSPFHSW